MTPERLGCNIGFVSTRFSGTDGVSLESSKWADVFTQYGHQCFWFAGELNRDPEKSLLVQEAHFQHNQNKWINDRIIGHTCRKASVTDMIHAVRSLLKKKLHYFIDKFNIDLLVVENALAIPMHIPLGLALTEVIAETQIPTIAHHHDFYWERSRYSITAAADYIRMAFPPNLPNIQHIVINSDAREQLALRTGISSIMIPNVLDFNRPPVTDIKKSQAFRESIHIAPDDKIILQPTRVVQRKGIEHAVSLIQKLNNPKYKLVISHEAGDEGFEYLDWLKRHAHQNHVEIRLVTSRLADPWLKKDNNNTSYSLWDVYPHADFITYPSHYEGFGNAFLEAVYFKKPILINRYVTFVKDIEPLGFDLTVMDGFLSDTTVDSIKKILESPDIKNRIVDRNFKIAGRHFSYAVLRNNLNAIMYRLFPGFQTRTAKEPDQQQIIDFNPPLVPLQLAN